MENTLADYGYDFQVKVLTGMLTDREFLIQCLGLLDSSYFNNDALKFLCKSTISYFNEYKLTPTKEVFKVQLSNVKDEILLKSSVQALKDAYLNIESTDIQFVKDKVIDFCKNQEIRKAYETSLKDFERGNYDIIATRFIEALKKGQVERDYGLDYLRDVEFRYTEEAIDERIKTGWDVIDEVTRGGLPKKKFGVVLAPLGTGKSWFLANLGAAALKAGKTVLHYTLELDDAYVAQRYDSILTGIQFDDLKYNIPKVQKFLEKYSGKLYIKEFPPGTLSIPMLEAHIDKYIMNGIVPDLVILDYAELMKIDFNTNLREDKVLGELYKDLRGLAGSKNFALWSADQINRENSTKDVIGNEGVSNSFAKLFAVDFSMTFSRKSKDKVNQTGRIHVSKSRLGPDGMTFPVKTALERGYIEILNGSTESGKKVQNQMISDDDYERQYGLQKFNSLMNRQRTETDIF